MIPRTALPLLLLGFAAAGCRSVTAAPEEIRLYEVADVLEHLDGVPKRGCCVLPIPATQEVVFPISWAAPLTAEKTVMDEERDAARQRSLELRGQAVAEEVARMRKFPNLGRSASGSSGVIEDPSASLLAHLRSRLAIAEGGPAPCRLEVRGGTTLEARGTPAVLAVVERALAELR